MATATPAASGVAIYGGLRRLCRNETQRSQHDWTANVAILSGNLNGNDDRINFVNMGENSLHVVRGATGATLDGVTITGGSAA